MLGRGLLARLFFSRLVVYRRRIRDRWLVVAVSSSGELSGACFWPKVTATAPLALGDVVAIRDTIRQIREIEARPLFARVQADGFFHRVLSQIDFRAVGASRGSLRMAWDGSLARYTPTRPVIPRQAGLIAS